MNETKLVLVDPNPNRKHAVHKNEKVKINRKACLAKRINGTGMKQYEIMDVLDELISNGYNMTIDEIAFYLKCSKRFIDLHIVPYVNRLQIGYLGRKLLTNESIHDIRFAKLKRKRILIHRTDFFDLLNDHLVMINRYRTIPMHLFSFYMQHKQETDLMLWKKIKLDFRLTVQLLFGDPLPALECKKIHVPLELKECKWIASEENRVLLDRQAQLIGKNKYLLFQSLSRYLDQKSDEMSVVIPVTENTERLSDEQIIQKINQHMIEINTTEYKKKKKKKK